MTVEHAFDDLFEECPTGVLIKSPSLNNVVQQLSTLEELHDNCDFHIFECEAVVHFDDVLMSKRF